MSQFGIQLHVKSDTKIRGNGKRKIKFRDRKRSEVGNYFSATKLSGADMTSLIRRRGGSVTARLKRAAVANILTKDGYKKSKITSVAESPDNRNFARQNIITKGAIIMTDAGKAVVTNRPGRDGAVNARLL